MQGIQVCPLTIERWSDLEELFGRKGAAIPGRCWCMYYRQSGTGASAEANKQALCSLVGSETAPGLIAYLNGAPAGWVSLGPRTDYPSLERSVVWKPVDDRPTWAIVCFFVDRTERGHGIADRLLESGIDYARSMGADILEATPVDKGKRVDNEAAFTGTKPMFIRAGFREVARRTPTRPLMRKELRGSHGSVPRAPSRRSQQIP